jgi:hypothetical protein
MKKIIDYNLLDLALLFSFLEGFTELFLRMIIPFRSYFSGRIFPYLMIERFVFCIRWRFIFVSVSDRDKKTGVENIPSLLSEEVRNGIYYQEHPTRVILNSSIMLISGNHSH